MDAWPTHTPVHAESAVRKRGKSKRQEREAFSPYLLLEANTVDTATLCDHHNKLTWSYLSRPLSKRKLVPQDNVSLKVFPTSRPLAPKCTDKSVAHRAEQGAHFLRTHYPDVDIPSELIREQLAVEAHLEDNYDEFDPYAGQLMASLSYNDGAQMHYSFLAFPTGETLNELNVSEVMKSANDGMTFHPAEASVKVFQSPIRQIVSSFPSSMNHSQNPLLAVRSFASTEIFSVAVRSHRTVYAPRVVLSGLASFDRSHVNDAQQADVAILQSSNQIFLCNNSGCLFRYAIDNPTTMMNTYNGSAIERAKSSTKSDDLFWRINLDKSDETCFLACSDMIFRPDFRSAEDNMPIYSLPTSKGVITSLNRNEAEGLLRIVTTSELFWLDPRYSSKPLLSYKHGRAYDRTLQTELIRIGDASLIILTSRRNGLLTVYDISSDHSGLIHNHVSPYHIPSPLRSHDAHLGYRFFQSPFGTHSQEVSGFQLSNQGSVHQVDYLLQSGGFHAYNPLHHATSAEWSQKLRDIDRSATSPRPGVGSLDARSGRAFDFRPIYNRLFGGSAPGKGMHPEVDAESVYGTLEKMSAFWQDMDAPIEHMLITFDIAFRSGNEPAHASRADFLTQSPLSNIRGFRALAQDHIPHNPTLQTAPRPWHHNIGSILHRFVPDFSEDPLDTFNKLQTYDLVIDDNRPGFSLRRELEARQQLTLDLALSSHVYCDRVFRRASDFAIDDEFETMSRAAEVMSLSDEDLAPVQFGYLTPKYDNHFHRFSQQQQDRGPDQPLGVRLLLREWQVGADPETYAYRDPYNVDGLNVSKRVVGSSAAPQRSQPHLSTAQRPPLVIPTPMVGPPPIIGSQPILARPQLEVQSQDVISTTMYHGWSQDAKDSGDRSGGDIASTQIVPGPYGGRQFMSKRKPVKKRIGGF